VRVQRAFSLFEMRRLLARAGAPTIAVVLFASAAEPEARAECEIEHDGVGLGLVLPFEDCAMTVHTDVGMAAVTEDLEHFGLQGYVEGGVLFAAPGARAFQLGPVVSLGGDSISDAADASHSLFETRLLLRTRTWLPPDPDGVVYIDAAFGPALLLPTEGRDPRRVGIYGELGVNLHGAAGIFFGVEPTWSLDGGALRTRYAFGGKTTASGFVLALAIYLCAEVRCF